MGGSRWPAVAALVDPVRRALYEYVRRQRRAVTREEAARAQSISRSLTAFHLDKLVELGLLQTRYEAPAGRRRGRGRTPKVYEPAGDGLSVSVPPRRYDLVGEILTDAVAAEPAAAGPAARREAFERGRAMAAGAAAGGDGDDLARVGDLLADVGFEPTTAAGGLILANCPFHLLATRQPELICGLNLAFVTGVLDGVGADRLTARLAPRPDACCVAVERAGE